MVTSSLGVQTDRRTRFWNPHMETCRHTIKKSTRSSKLVVSRRSLYASPGGRGCITSHGRRKFSYENENFWQCYFNNINFSFSFFEIKTSSFFKDAIKLATKMAKFISIFYKIRQCQQRFFNTFI